MCLKHYRVKSSKIAIVELILKINILIYCGGVITDNFFRKMLILHTEPLIMETKLQMLLNSLYLYIFNTSKVVCAEKVSVYIPINITDENVIRTS